MSVVSVTVVGAFDIVGSILVVALMVAPPISAYLLTDHLPRMLGLSVIFGALSALSGFWLATLLDASIAGSMASMAGLIFALVLSCHSFVDVRLLFHRLFCRPAFGIPRGISISFYSDYLI